MTRADIIRIHDAVDRDRPETYITAANMMVPEGGERFRHVNEAVAALQVLFKSLLDRGLDTEAALLCWGTRLFDPRPRAVQKLWKKLNSSNKLLVMGAGSMSKSYTGIAWFVLDFQRDPEYTAVKLVSTTSGHAKANTWSSLVRFHRESIIPFAGEVQASFIGIDPDDRHASISIVAIPQGQDSKSRLQGFHPIPRTSTHPIFGTHSRVRIFIDEAEDAPSGMWQGIQNALGSQTASGNVKVYAATNPKNKASAFAQRAEPVNGWHSINVTWEEWQSALGWDVLHLDAATSENVIEKRVIYEGLQTYEGYTDYEKLGISHPDYWTFARGWYPETRVQYAIVPPYITKEIRGVYTFQRVIANIATLDPAFEEGGDAAMLTSGRYGLAIGFQPFGTKDDGSEVQLDYQNFADNPRYVIQAEQQFPIQKQDTEAMAEDTISILRELRVTPEWFAMDRTGNAKGLFDVLSSRFGDILGIQWGEGATDKKILEEDSDVANERYEGLVTEMWFAAARYMEHGYIKIAPMMQTVTRLFNQLTGRNYHRITKTLQRAESKAEYKKRNNSQSPDEADSFIMMVHLIRMRADVNAAALPENRTDPAEERRRAEMDTDTWINVGPNRNSGVVSPHRVKFVKVGR